MFILSKMHICNYYVDTQSNNNNLLSYKKSIIKKNTKIWRIRTKSIY